MTEMEKLVDIHEDINSRILISKLKCNIETFSVAINLRKKKWFLNGSYNPHQNLISNHLECQMMNIVTVSAILFL